MKYLSLFLVLANMAFATSVVYSNIWRRDTPGEIIASVLYNISNETSLLNDQITRFTLNTALALQDQTQLVIQTINVGIDNVAPLGNLSDSDVALLFQPISTVSQIVNTTIESIIAKKDALGGLGFVVQESVKTQQNLTLVLSTDIISKVPPAFTGIASNLSLPIFQSLSQGLMAYATVGPNPIPIPPAPPLPEVLRATSVSAGLQLGPLSTYNLFSIAALTFAATRMLV